MGLETATYIADLNTANPTGSDLRSEGDNHIRLLKAVLQNTFPDLDTEFPVSESVAKTFRQYRCRLFYMGQL